MKTASISLPFTNTRQRRAAADDNVKPQFNRLTNPRIEIVVPVLNEAATLRQSITTLNDYMSQHLPYRYQITIADNGSSDNTQSIARDLAQQYDTVRTVRLSQRGRGRALKAVWLASKADIVSYMDVDLSTDLDSFLPMIEPLISGQAGIGIGSRLHKQSRTTRGFKREFISRAYNRIIKLSSRTTFSDAQCGFKAMRRDVAEKFLPRIKDDEWFFDTELLIKAERAHVRIHEQPVQWIEDTDSRVHIIKTASQDLRGLARVRSELDGRPLYQKFALPVTLLAAGAMYLYGALQNGMANSYYAAAVQAASTNWIAWLFGSLDSANYISVDKPPIATMVMGLSARIFGFSSFSMLLPEVLAGVGTIWLVYAAVKRQFGFASAIIAAITLALTPVAALMFGFNNPDAILTLLLSASAYAFLRSLEERRPLLWLSLAGLFTGLAFNTKMLQGMLVLPAMVIVYLAFAKPPIITRLLQLGVAAVVTAVSTLWWSVLVWLTPASHRPWVGSTSDNNIWSLIFGYNGFGRLLGKGQGGGMGGAGGMGDGFRQMGAATGNFGGTTTGTAGTGTTQMMTPPTGATGGMMGGAGGAGGGPGGGMGGRSGFGGQTGIFRIFNGDFGPNIGWLLLFALIGGGVMLWILRKTPRVHRGRAAVIFWMLWLLIHIVIFSMTSGTIHPYYVVVMSPAVAALIGISLPFMWGAYKRRKAYAIALPIAVAATSAIGVVLLGYSNAYPWLSWLVAISGAVSAIGLTIGLLIENKLLQRIAAGLAIIACLAAPVTYTFATINATHTGSIPTSGPSATALSGSNNENAVAESSLVRSLLAHRDGATWIVAVASANQSAAIQLTSKQPVMAVGGFNGGDSALTLAQFKALIADGKLKYYAVSAGGQGGMGGGSMGGNSEIATYVTTHGTKVNYGGSDVTLYAL